MQKDEIIEQYVQNQFRLFRLRGKKPAIQAWQNIKEDPFLDPKTIDKNFGITLQSDDLVIDIDVSEKDDGTFKTGRESFDRLVKETGLDFKNTFGVQTGTGGFHFYFKKPKDFPIRESWRKFKDIEFKSKGRYVVGAGSIHPKTNKPYKIVIGRMSDIMPAPTALLDIIKFVPVDFGNITSLKGYTDDPQSIERCKTYLESTDPAVQGSAGDKQTYIVACRCREFGLSPEIVLEMMDVIWNPTCKPSWSLDELKQKVYNAYKYDPVPLGINSPEVVFADIPLEDVKEKNFWATEVRADGTRKKHIQNTVCYMNEIDDLRGLLKYNLFTDTIELRKIPKWYPKGKPMGCWTDNDAIWFKYEMAVQQKYDINVMDANEAAVIYSSKRKYHPIKNYLNPLIWDKKDRVSTWLTDYAHIKDNEYVRAVGARVLLAAVKRIYEPGCKFDNVLVIEGDQGAGKSRLIEALGMKWYSDQHIDPHHKDTVACMRDKWIIEVSEMTCVKKAEVNAMKSFLSRNTDRKRLSHMKHAQDYPRQCIFIGTINPDEVGYLSDNTGNRRFWPVLIPPKCKVKVKELQKDIDQIWAEVMYRYNQGNTDLHIADMRVEKIALQEAEKRNPTDEWYGTITNWLNHVRADGLKLQHVRPMQIWSDCLNGVPRSIKRMDQVRITNVMKLLGWVKGSYTSDGKAVWGYTRPIEEEEREVK
jgi:predicted P-loop ATPase